MLSPLSTTLFSPLAASPSGFPAGPGRLARQTVLYPNAWRFENTARALAPVGRKTIFAGLLGIWLARKQILAAIKPTVRTVTGSLKSNPTSVGLLILGAAATLMLFRRLKPQPAPPLMPLTTTRPTYEALFGYSDILQSRKLEASRARFRLEVELVNTPGGTARYESLLAQINEQRELEQTIAQKLTCLALAM